MKYKFEIDGNRVIAYCNYAGKRIQASANCMPEDNFDANKGMLIAAKRLDCKIQLKRYKRALKRMEEANIKSMIVAAEALDRAQYLNKMEDLLNEMEADYDEFMRAYS